MQSCKLNFLTGISSLERNQCQKNKESFRCHLKVVNVAAEQLPELICELRHSPSKAKSGFKERSKSVDVTASG